MQLRTMYVNLAERQQDREAERQRDKQTERQKVRKQKDRETERKKDGKTEWAAYMFSTLTYPKIQQQKDRIVFLVDT